MRNNLPNFWKTNLTLFDIAFQPILNIQTGEIFGVEALLRNYRDAGFKSIFSVFDQAYKDGILYEFDLALREITFKKYKNIKTYENIKLFYNLDNRLFENANNNEGNTKSLLKKLDIQKDNIYFEISERHEISSQSNMQKVLQHYKDENYSIAIDDFGVGYSGYKLLYDSTPEIIKIDRFFIQDIEKSIKKKLMLRSITHLAIQLGVKIIAEGIETKEELLTCKEIGCHLVQGYLIQKATKDTDEILDEYSHIVEIIKNDKRSNFLNSKMESYLEKIYPINVDTKMGKVIEYFKENKNNQIVPIVDSNNEAVGIMHETRIKEFLYSPYGISLLSNDDSKKTKLKHLMEACGSCDINSEISTIIELFSNNPESSGIIITKKSKYYGFLSTRSIITIMNEESLLLARDSNPLTKLPGNRMIENYIAESSKNESYYLLCYFDLDNFKAFNDVYGFRNGDRVIQLFADIVRKHLPYNFFKAHIGGDDFFVAIKSDKKIDTFEHKKLLENVIYKFSQSAMEFYSKEDKEKGFILSKDRDGTKKTYPLLTVSASIIEINKKSINRSIENINNILSLQKKVAKSDINHISLSTLI